jgi:NAD(P)-dependent dehydrogenase (short-subunit alcohol dehydrogenase family)
MADVDPSTSTFLETLGKAPAGQRLKGRKILIVGGGQRDQTDADKSIGNGRAMSVFFAREGATVVILDYNERAAKDTVAHIKSEGGNAIPYVFDVRNAGGIPKAVNDAKSIMGGLDGMAVVVGVSRRIPLSETTAEMWDEDFAMNVRSHFLFSKHALEVMNPGGSIVIISSMSAIRALDNNPVYEASKAALLGPTKAVARAGEDKGVRCNAICMVSLLECHLFIPFP